MALTDPRTLHGFNVYVEGGNYAGKVEEGSTPEFKYKAKEVNNAGAISQVKSLQQLDELSCKVKLQEYSAEMRKLLGRRDGGQTLIQFYAAIGDDTSVTTDPVAITVRGTITELKASALKNGDGTSDEYTISNIRFYEEKIAGEEIIYYDYQAAILRIGGVDQNESIRTNCKL